MPYERPAGAERVVASVDVRHGAMAADDGFCGRVVKTLTPSADTPRNLRNMVLAGEEYTIRTKNSGEVDNSTLAGIAKGALVYITEATNAISNAAGVGKIVLGRVTHLPGERGTPTNMVRVDLDSKV